MSHGCKDIRWLTPGMTAPGHQGVMSIDARALKKAQAASQPWMTTVKV